LKNRLQVCQCACTILVFLLLVYYSSTSILVLYRSTQAMPLAPPASRSLANRDCQWHCRPDSLAVPLAVQSASECTPSPTASLSHGHRRDGGCQCVPVSATSIATGSASGLRVRHGVGGCHSDSDSESSHWHCRSGSLRQPLALPVALSLRLSLRLTASASLSALANTGRPGSGTDFQATLAVPQAVPQALPS
jgi:hypothetical protein